MNLNGRAAVFCGAGPGALWKCELLAAAGADLRIFCPVPDADMVGLADRLKGVGLFRRTPTASDFEGAAIAVIDSDDLALVEEVRAMARKAGALVNVVDKPSYCDFSFGSIVNRSPLVVGIATGGAAPATGADTGSVGRRRRPGMADSTEPTTTSAPPIHSHMTSGWTTTPNVHAPPRSGIELMVR